MRRSKKRLNKYFLLLLLLGVSVGFALLSTTLKINGIGGVLGSTWDIHWENVQPNAESTVTAAKPQISENATKVSYEVTLELPGDYYEFDVDAKNSGTIAGTINEIRHNIYKVVEEGEDSTVPDYIKYSLVYKGTNIEPAKGDVLGPGEKQTYTVRIEFDKNATTIPDTDTVVKVDDEIDYVQEDIRGTHKVTFDPNGGVAYPTVKYVKDGATIGSLADARKPDNKLKGWYKNNQEVTSSFKPTSDITITAEWTSSYTTFLPGTDVNIKLKSLAGNIDPTTGTQDAHITSITRSNTAPAQGTTTENLAIEGAESILAWYENGTIKIYSAADDLYLNSDASNMFNNLTEVTSIYTNYITNETTNMSAMFSSNSSLESLDLSSFNTSNVTDMSTMFASTALTSLDLSNFDTSKVTNMSAMFASTALTSLDLSSFNTSNVTNMSNMFASTALTSLDLSNFDVSRVNNFSGTFAGMSNLKTLNLNNWNFASVTSLSGMFSMGLTKLETLSLNNVNTSKITNMSGMFAGCSSLKSLDLSSFDTSSVFNMGGMLQNCSSITNLDLSNFDTSNVTNMGSMLSGMTSLKTLNISNFNFSSYNQNSLMMQISAGGFAALETLIMDNVVFPSNCSYALGGLTTVKTISLEDANTSSVTCMSAMFNGDSLVTTLDLSSFNTSRVTDMGSMFANMTNLTTIKVSDGFVVDGVTSSGGMFYNDTNLVGGAGTAYDFDHIDKEYAHYDYGEDNPGYFNLKYNDPITITLNPNGGTVSPTKKIIEKGTSIENLPKPIKASAKFIGWYTALDGGTKVDGTYAPTTNQTLYAHWQNYSGEATFDTGKAVNTKWKHLAGTGLEDDSAEYDVDNNVTTITRSQIEPDTSTMTEDNEVQSANSSKKIYSWYDNGTIYWWSEATGIYLNEDASNMFSDFTSLTDVYLDFDTRNTTDVNRMFYGCRSIEEIDLSGWNTSNVTDMFSLVVFTDSLVKLDLTGWDFTAYNPSDGWLMSKISGGMTSNHEWTKLKTIKMDNVIFPTNMYATFSYVSAEEISLKNVDTSNVTNMEYVFRQITNIKSLDLSSFDTSKVTSMYGLFEGADDLESVDVSSFNTSRLTSLRHIFYDCKDLKRLDVSNFNTSNVTDFSAIFSYSINLETVNLSNWDFTKFNSSSLINHMGLSGSINSQKVKILIMDNVIFPANMYYTFADMPALETISLRNVNTSKATDMGRLFYKDPKLTTIDLSSFNTVNVTNMANMFDDSPELTTIYAGSGFTTINYSANYNVFSNNTKLVGGNGTKFDPEHVGKEYARIDEAGTPGYFTRATLLNNVHNAMQSAIRDLTNKLKF